MPPGKASFPCHMHRDMASVESVVHWDDLLGQRLCRDGIETRTINKLKKLVEEINEHDSNEMSNLGS